MDNSYRNSFIIDTMRIMLTTRLSYLRHWDWDKVVADYIVKYIFFNENFWILNKVSLKYVPLGVIKNIAALV